MTSDIESRVINVTAQVLKVDQSKVTPDSSFTNDLGADSLDSVELMMAFEAEFNSNNLNIPDEDAAKIATVRNAIDYIKTKISE
jgi:acyl carrier protein